MPLVYVRVCVEGGGERYTADDLDATDEILLGGEFQNIGALLGGVFIIIICSSGLSKGASTCVGDGMKGGDESF